jgi:uncharacterized membrane protein
MINIKLLKGGLIKEGEKNLTLIVYIPLSALIAASAISL